MDYELLAVKLGDAVKWDVSKNEIERIARATLGIAACDYPHPAITSVRAQTVYNYVKTLAHAALGPQEKRGRLSHFIRELLPEDAPARPELLHLVGETHILPEHPPDFSTLVRDPTLGAILEKRWREVQQCVDAEAYLAAIVMMGSLLEGMLLSVVTAHPSQANQTAAAPKDSRSGKPKPFGEWTLSQLIEVAHACGWLQRDVRDFSQELRDYRNLVHPRYQHDKNFHPDADTCRICWEVVRAAIGDLARAR